MPRGVLLRGITGARAKGLGRRRRKSRSPLDQRVARKPAVFADTDDMSLLLRRWRHKLSPAARRGREAAHEHTAWVAQQRTSTQGSQVTAGAEKR
jgi:hypothetical protein